MGPYMKKFGLLVTAFALVTLLLLTSCTSPKVTKQSGANSQSESKMLIALDKAKAIEQNIDARKGGYLGLKTADGIKARVMFGRESLSKNSTLVVTPISKLPKEDENLLTKGFFLEEKGTGKGPELKLPAVIVFSIKGTLPKTASIVKYHENDEGYDIIPTTSSVKNGTTILSASVLSFSSYGARKLTADEQKQAQENSAKKLTANHPRWIIKVNDSYSFKRGSMDTQVAMNLEAASQSDSIDGLFKGTVSATVEQVMKDKRGQISAPVSAQDKNLSFSVYHNLAPLVEAEEDGPLASLVPPEDMPDWSGSGNFNMTSKGSYTISVPGGSVGGAMKTPKTSTPFELTIIGSHVKLVVKDPMVIMYFDGTIQRVNP